MKRRSWWRLALAAFGGAVWVLIGQHGPGYLAVAVVVNAGVWALGEWLRQSTTDLCKNVGALLEFYRERPR